jgi:hypothetical protein
MLREWLVGCRLHGDTGGWRVAPPQTANLLAAINAVVASDSAAYSDLNAVTGTTRAARSAGT